MLNAERGDCGSVSKIIEQYSSTLTQDGTDLKPDSFDINCTDPLGRTALSIAIINENPELIEILLESGIQTRDSLLLALMKNMLKLLSCCWSTRRERGK